MAASKGNKNAKGNKGGGRKSEYRPEYAKQALKLCLMGATDKDLAEFFGVTVRTINRWKKDKIEFMSSLKKGKDEADANVASMLYHRATGYSHPDVHISNYKGKITVTELTKHYPPDTTAAIFWLKNRQPDKWREKHEVDVKVEQPLFPDVSKNNSNK